MGKICLFLIGLLISATFPVELGLGMAHETEVTTSQDINGESKYKTTQNVPAFKFLLGGELHLNIIKFFVRSKMSLYLKNMLPVNDYIVVPLVMNTQAGFLIPIDHKRNN
jgi:hypothetical protein